MSVISDLGYWFILWYEDKISILETMHKNLMSDLDAGYDPNGYCIKNQLADIDSYQTRLNDDLERLKALDDKQMNRWCKIDLVKRGVIA